MEKEELIELINPVKESDYSVNVDLKYIENTLEGYMTDAMFNGGSLILTPDFQRGHVWSRDQQIHYVENFFRNIAPRNIKFVTGQWLGNNPFDDYMKNIYCLDGLQRLTAMRQFIKGDFNIFGVIGYNDLTKAYLNRRTMIFEIYVCQTRGETLKMYIDLNSGGTPHSVEEIERIKGLLSGKRRID